MPNSSEVIIKGFVLALRTKKEEVGTLYRVEMSTTQMDYGADKKIFERIVRSWRGLKTAGSIANALPGKL